MVRALWQLATVKERVNQARFTQMLDIGARALRPKIPMLGTMSYLDHGHIVYEAVAWTGNPADRPASDVIFVGNSRSFGDTAQSLIYADGLAHAWNDIEQSEIATLSLPALARARSAIGCTMQIGPRTYFLVYSSVQTMLIEPFSDEDLDFINVVGRIFASTINQIQYLDRLRHQMEHDGLTGLPNRVQFRKAIREEINRAQPFAIALINLDRFRQVNEIHGQMVADEALVEVASELSAIGSDTLVARMSGDEFGVLMRGPTNTDELALIIEQYRERFYRPFHTGDRDGTRMVAVGASAGWAAYPDHGMRAEELLRRADVALDIAKDRGGGNAVVFHTSMEQIIEQRRVAADDVQRAVLENEFRLVYQPTFDLASGAIVGAEALIRWDHPLRGELSPADFIPIAERNGLIGSVSLWVLKRLIDELDNATSLPATFRCYFNLSAQNLEDFTFLTTLTDALTDFPQLIERLGIEITETTAMLNVEQSMNSLSLLQRLGVHIAIDDFGTGYSSLSYLKRLSVDLVKIDRSFITGLPDDEQDAALTEMMIDICSRFKLSVLGEGIETIAQRDWLLAHGCRYGQGYLVAKPMSFDALLQFIETRVAGDHLMGAAKHGHHAGT
jgi:diguanylate cyclase (GGDEF)-like protein